LPSDIHSEALPIDPLTVKIRFGKLTKTEEKKGHGNINPDDFFVTFA
jgi:hypothetical protein